MDTHKLDSGATLGVPKILSIKKGVRSYAVIKFKGTEGLNNDQFNKVFKNNPSVPF